MKRCEAYPESIKEGVLNRLSRCDKTGCNSDVVSYIKENSIFPQDEMEFYRRMKKVEMQYRDLSMNITFQKVELCGFRDKGVGNAKEYFENPPFITAIGPAAFCDCKSLKKIVIPNSVTSIMARAFARCESLEDVTIPDSVTRIDWGAFYGCNSLNYKSQLSDKFGEKVFYK